MSEETSEETSEPADTELKMYSVFGFYTDTGLRYESHTEAASPDEAVQQTAGLYPDESISIVAIVEGFVTNCMDGDHIEDTDDLEVR